MDTQELYKQVNALVEKGNDAEVRAFVVEHINEFPDDVRSQIAMFFFEEAAHTHAAGLQAEAELVEGAIAGIEQLAPIKRFLEDTLKLSGIRDRLQLPGTDPVA